MSFEKEYEEWFEKYLSEVESPHDYEHNSPLLNKPKKFRPRMWFAINFISIVVCLIGSFLLIQYKNEIYIWFSNLLLSLSSGLLASLIILAFTNSKERNISYYNDIIPLLKSRYKTLRYAYNFCWPKLSIAYQTNNVDDYFKYEHYFSNTNIVIIGFMEYILKSFNFNRRFPYKLGDLEIAAHKVIEASNICQQEYYKDKINDKDKFEEIDKLCNEASLVPADILNILEALIEELEQELYKIKYYKKKKIDF